MLIIFWQIHRSSIVNISFISQVSKNEQDKLMVYLSNGQVLPILVVITYICLKKCKCLFIHKKPGTQPGFYSQKLSVIVDVH